LYREGRRRAGRDPDGGRVTLMLHTLIGPDRDWVRRAVERPFTDYIRSSLNSHLRERTQPSSRPFNAEERDDILQYAFERYFETGAMFGTVADCQRVVTEAVQAGVGEIACLMDFGVDTATVNQSLLWLKELCSSYRVN
jgi:alkanesulfonate monooxygenase SsuD/methylene tetrahydromethanopterin reductase-like flavin-dependent oxidoreductase (luciferase family)